MQNIKTYTDYWKQRQCEQNFYNQKIAKEARKNLDKIVELLVNKFQAKKIILFGSLAKGNFHRDSDIDLAVEGINPTDYFTALAAVNSLSDHAIDLKPLEALESHFLQRILETGECLYASNISQ
jgi:predicted nucleotidyltransferase